ncbi:MAG: hypothetical protein ACI4DN_12100, partial [Lachnospiraceae bacterium]
MLFCKHGGIITPVTSGQEQSQISRSVMSKEGLLALMELEIFNNYSNSKGYLVIEEKKLIGIKPHLVGDRTVTVAFGDSLQRNDINFYLEESRKSKIIGYLSDEPSEYGMMKDTIIPVEICFEKLLIDANFYYQDIKKCFNENGIELSQQELDSLTIISYQCGKTGKSIYKEMGEIIGKAENQDIDYVRQELEKWAYKQHGSNGSFEARVEVEKNIFFDGDYTVEGGLGDSVIVEPLINYEK